MRLTSAEGRIPAPTGVRIRFVESILRHQTTDELGALEREMAVVVDDESFVFVEDVAIFFLGIQNLIASQEGADLRSKPLLELVVEQRDRSVAL